MLHCNAALFAALFFMTPPPPPKDVGILRSPLTVINTTRRCYRLTFDFFSFFFFKTPSHIWLILQQPGYGGDLSSCCTTRRGMSASGIFNPHSPPPLASIPCSCIHFSFLSSTYVSVSHGPCFEKHMSHRSQFSFSLLAPPNRLQMERSYPAGNTGSLLAV